MRILILGGTVFVGRAIARRAVEAGHDVTCAARGASGEPVEGADFVRADRDEPDGLAALEGDFDALIDIARRPSHVRNALALLAGRVGHATYVSTCSVYADTATPGQDRSAPVIEPGPPDLDDPTATDDAYGQCKLHCEQLYLDAFGAERVFLPRPGLIIGPEDPIGRFAYWIRRIERGGELLVPGSPDDLVQHIDVRDLATWVVSAAEGGLVGAYDAVAPSLTRQEFTESIFDGRTTPTYVPQDFLFANDVGWWHGPRSIPMWVPLPEYGGMFSRDASPSYAVGLPVRPLADSARDTAAWFTDAVPVTGLTDDEERDVLAAWHARA